VGKDVGRAMEYGAATNTLLGAAGTQAPVLSQEAKNMIQQGIVPTVGQAVDKAMIIVPANRFPSASRQRLHNDGKPLKIDGKPLKIIILMDFHPDIPRSCPLPWPKR
jgi:hypothetical protein